MDYYNYECSILQQLNDRLKIESITIDSDFYEATKTIRNHYGKLENIVVSKINIGRTIQLDFPLNFHYRFDPTILKKSYEQKCDSTFIIDQIIRDVEKAFIDKFLVR